MKASQLGVKLSGDRNQCSGCSELFNSSHAFDKHRTGTHGADRRCRTADEMEQEGMFKGTDGFWRGSRMRDGIRGHGSVRVGKWCGLPRCAEKCTPTLYGCEPKKASIR